MPQQNQHYVPKFLLKNFVDSDGKVFCLNKKTDQITKRPPKYAGSRINFNEFIVAGEAVSFEERFQKVETRAAPAFRKIIESCSLAFTTRDERQKISDFIAIQGFRTEAFREGLGADVDNGELGLILERLWESSFLASHEIERRKWLLMKIGSQDNFYLGDNPFVLQHTTNPEAAQTLGIDIKGVEAYLPITPKLALYMPCRTTTSEIINGYQNAILLRSQCLRHLMRGTPSDLLSTGLVEANKVITSAKPFYESVISGAVLPVTHENIENLNYLQCAWAYESVFSSSKDYTFAKHVLLNTPQYRGFNKSHIAAYGSPTEVKDLS